MKFEGTNNPIYTQFFAKSELDASTEKSKWRGTDSHNSFCFINPEVKYKEREREVLCKLKEVFDIKSELFDKKFRMAISGDGQEVKRIAVLHSSSLAALLMFYSISEEKRLKCTLDKESYEFYDSFFEVKTNVKADHYSNMDVVLIGKDSAGKDVIFFLECKFSEYLSTGMCNNISIDAYKDKYNELGLLNNESAIQGLHFTEGLGKEGKKCLQITSDNPQYCHGIKQMISHYMGVSNFAESGVNALDAKQSESEFYKRLPELLQDGTKIILGEILFDFRDTIDKSDDPNECKICSYNKAYVDLAKVLNSHTKDIIILPEILTYQKLMENFELDPNVRTFYQL